MAHHHHHHHHIGQQQMGYTRHNQFDQKIICYRCGTYGHKSTYCQENQISATDLEVIQAQNPENGLANQRVVCFSCHRKGHYANACPEKAARAANSANGQN